MYVSIKQFFCITKLLLSMSINSSCKLVTFCTRELRESRDMVFLDDIFCKVLIDLPALDPFLSANDRFSISAIFFHCKVDGFNLEAAVNSDCIFSFSS